MLESKPLREDDKVFSFQKQPITWLKSDWFCRECGKQNVWQRSDDGEDYYHDCSAECHSCGAYMCCLPKLDNK